MIDGHFELKNENPNLFQEIEKVSSILPAGIDLFPSFVMELLKSLDSSQIQEAAKYLSEVYKVRYEIFLRISRYINEQENISLSEQDKMLDTLKMLNNFHGFVQAHKSEFDQESEDIRSKKQGDVYESTWIFLERNGNLGYIDSPTGSGKTNMMVNLTLETGLNTVIVAPTNEILEQTYNRIKQIANNKGRNPYIRLINQDTKDPALEELSNSQDFDQEITLITYVSFVIDSEKSEDKRRISANSAQLILLDEAHESLTEKRFNARDQFPDSIRIGFTGTAFAVNNENYGELIHQINIKEAIQEGMLSSVKTMLISIDYDTDDWVLERGDYRSEDIDRFVKDTKLSDILVDIYINKFSDEEGNLKQGLIFFNSIEQAEVQAKKFREQGILSYALHSKLAEDERERIDTAFKNGEFPVLTAVRSIARGWDYPELAVVINALPSTSPERISQQAGRALRVDINNPDKVAIVIDTLIEDRKLGQVIYADILGNAELSRNKQYGTTPNNGVPEEKGEKDDDSEKLPLFPNVRVISDIHALTEILNARKSEIESTEVPEGWLSLPRVAEQFGLYITYFSNPTSKGKQMLAQLLAEYQDKGIPADTYSRTFGTGTRYSPEFIMELKNKLDAVSIPEDWVSLMKLALSLRKTKGYFSHPSTIGSQILKQLLAEFRNRGITEDTYSRTSGSGKYYSPEFIGILRSKLQEAEIPAGWISLIRLAAELNIYESFSNKRPSKGTRVLQQLLTEYKNRAIPESTYLFRRNLEIYYSPEFIMELKNKLNAVNIPDGWVSLSALSQSLDKGDSYFSDKGLIGYKLFNQVLGEFRSTGIPEDTYSKTMGNGIYYSPDFIKELKSKVDAINVPDGWLSLRALALNLKKNTNYFSSNSVSYKLLAELSFELKNRGISEDTYSKAFGKGVYYSPEFIELLLKKLNQES